MVSRHRHVWLALGLLLPACSVGDDAAAPILELPPLAPTSLDLQGWWRRFGDPQLEQLVERTLVHNQDLRAAVARVEQAAALVRDAEDLLPLANLRAGAGRNQTSDKNAFPRFAGIDRRNYAFSLALDVTYEIDLWGRIRAANRAVLADLAADRDAMLGLHSLLAAQTAQAYYRLTALDQRLQLLHRTLANRDDAVRIQQRRQAAGNGTALEVHQAEADRAAIAGALPAAAAAVASTERALLLLTGASPRDLAAAGAGTTTERATGPAVERTIDLPEPPAVPADLPSDLLQRRPDVREAERRLAAAAARTSEARARYFPAIRLTGSLGQESKDLGDLLTSPATVWNLAAGITQPLLGTRKIDAQVDAAEAQRVEAEAAYVRAVQGAFAEIYDALGTLRAATDTRQAQQQQRDALAAAERIASARNAAGAGSFLELLDARRNLLAVETQQIDTRLERLTATIDVFRALGGGFGDPAAEPDRQRARPDQDQP